MDFRRTFFPEKYVLGIYFSYLIVLLGIGYSLYPVVFPTVVSNGEDIRVFLYKGIPITLIGAVTFVYFQMIHSRQMLALWVTFFCHYARQAQMDLQGIEPVSLRDLLSEDSEYLIESEIRGELKKLYRMKTTNRKFKAQLRHIRDLVHRMIGLHSINTDPGSGNQPRIPGL